MNSRACRRRRTSGLVALLMLSGLLACRPPATETPAAAPGSASPASASASTTGSVAEAHVEGVTACAQVPGRSRARLAEATEADCATAAWLSGVAARRPRLTHTVAVFGTAMGTQPVRAHLLSTLEVCSDDICLPVALTPFDGEMTHGADGEATLVGQAELPLPSVTTVRLGTGADDGGGLPTRWQSVALPVPLPLDARVRGVRLLLGLVPAGAPSSEAQALPVRLHSADAGWLSWPERELPDTPVTDGTGPLFYNPVSGLRRALGLHAHAWLPPGATAGVRILQLRAYRGTGEWPDVRLGPASLLLQKPLQLTLKPLDMAWMWEDGAPDPAFMAREAQQAARAPAQVLSLPEAGRLVNGVFLSVREQHAQARRLGPEGTADLRDCLQRLRSPDVQARIRADLRRHGISIINACTTVPPRVHLVMVDAGQTAMQLELAFRSRPDPVLGRVLQLTRLDRLGDFAVMVNGFNWHGDQGEAHAPGVGVAIGFARGMDLGNEGRRTTLGDNSAGGHAHALCSANPAQARCVHATQPDGRKRVGLADAAHRHLQWQTRTDRVEDLAQHPLVLSSSTSILVDGRCRSGTTRSRWSALGTHPDGRALFVSSTVTGTTQVAELCQLMRALGMQDGIRLDGGISATMTLRGQLVNPFADEGDDLIAAIHGHARHVAYGVGAVRAGTGRQAAGARLP